jgi:hypothetical protein
LIAMNLIRSVLLGATLLGTAPCVAASDPPSQDASAAPAAAKAPKMKLHFSGLLAGRSYTITLLEGATFVGETSPPNHVTKTANRLTFEVPEAPKGSDAPEIEEAMIETDVEISARTVTYQVELSGRTSVEIDLLGVVEVRGRPLQVNGVPLKISLPIPDLPAGWVLRAPPCPPDPTGKARTAAVHAGWSACRPAGNP